MIDLSELDRTYPNNFWTLMCLYSRGNYRDGYSIVSVFPGDFRDFRKKFRSNLRVMAHKLGFFGRTTVDCTVFFKNTDHSFICAIYSYKNAKLNLISLSLVIDKVAEVADSKMILIFSNKQDLFE